MHILLSKRYVSYLTFLGPAGIYSYIIVDFTGYSRKEGKIKLRSDIHDSAHGRSHCRCPQAPKTRSRPVTFGADTSSNLGFHLQRPTFYNFRSHFCVVSRIPLDALDLLKSSAQISPFCVHTHQFRRSWAKRREYRRAARLPLAD